MNARAFVDTNVLVYANAAPGDAKSDAARALLAELWTARRGVVSTQVLQELAWVLRRKGRLDGAAVRGAVTPYLAWHVIVNDGAATLRALDVEARFGVSFWDALIIQAAQAAGAEVLYSEDLADGQLYGSVRVSNPFA